MRLFSLVVALLSVQILAQAETVEVFRGAIKIETPKSWKSVPPGNRIIEKEYSISKDGVEGKARLTMMAAGGDIKANISRWEGQFSKSKGAKVEEITVGDNVVHIVELEGTFKDKVGGGPFFGGKSVMRDDYQMLAAIVVNDGRKYFIKMTGPKGIVDSSKDAFKKMLKEIK